MSLFNRVRDVGYSLQLMQFNEGNSLSKFLLNGGRVKGRSVLLTLTDFSEKHLDKLTSI